MVHADGYLLHKAKILRDFVYRVLCQAPLYTPTLRCSLNSFRIALLLSLTVALASEAWFLPQTRASSEQEQDAIQLMRRAMADIRLFRIEQGPPIDLALDPNQTGLIGLEYSDITTTEGSLIAKRTSLNPAFAGLVVRLLHEAGVTAGDRVALNLTGSFPALNMAVISACHVLGLQPQIISSVGASTYGANIPGLTWLDMERRLYERGVLPFRAIAVSYGGVVEIGGGIDGTGMDLATQAIARHGAPLLNEGDYRSVADDMVQRKAIFEKNGAVSAFINVGGALTSLGWIPEAAKLDSGFIKNVPLSKDKNRGLIFRYQEEGVPVIHLLNIVRLAERYALPVDPIPLPVNADKSRFLWRYLLCAVLLSIWGGGCLLLLRKNNHAI